jgi:branched-subunit amino acid aminotransferase/4-amino-4-deoxychorismate lyase
MTEPLAYLNGQFLPFSELSISVADAGFVFGATVSEYVRTFGGKLFRLDDHIARLRESCHLCRMTLLASDDELRFSAEKLVECNAGVRTNTPSPPSPLPQSRERGERQIPTPGPSPRGGEKEEETIGTPNSGKKEASGAPLSRLCGRGDGGEGSSELALIIFATPGPLPHLGGADIGPTVGMHTFPLPFGRYRHLFTSGAKLIVPSIRRDSSVDPQAKMRSRMNWWIAEQEVRQLEPDAWALLLDADGFITETAAANFLIVRNGTVFSPPWNSILNGVSLRVVKELCHELHIPFVERPIRLEDCRSADEAMLTGTAFCICGVSSINGLAVPWRGPVFSRLTLRWSERFGMNFIGQFVS